MNITGIDKPVIVLQVQTVDMPFRAGPHAPPPGSPVRIQGSVLETALPVGWGNTALALSMFGQAPEPWVLCPMSVIEDILRREQRALMDVVAPFAVVEHAVALPEPNGVVVGMVTGLSAPMPEVD